MKRVFLLMLLGLTIIVQAQNKQKFAHTLRGAAIIT